MNLPLCSNIKIEICHKVTQYSG